MFCSRNALLYRKIPKCPKTFGHDCTYLNLRFFAFPLAFFLGLKVVFITTASSIGKPLAFSRLPVVVESGYRCSAGAHFLW